MTELAQRYDESDAAHKLWELNKLFVEDYQFLESQFPRSVRVEENILDIAGKKVCEFRMQVGEPLEASDVFGQGRSLEVGGGASDYSKLQTIKGSFRPTIVTDIKDGGGVGALVDARKLPFPDSSFQSVLAIALTGRDRQDVKTGDIHPKFLAEAYRVIEPGGYLLVAHATREDLRDALALGFTMELGTGCVMARVAAVEGSLPYIKDTNDRVYMDLEILLHK